MRWQEQRKTMQEDKQGKAELAQYQDEVRTVDKCTPQTMWAPCQQASSNKLRFQPSQAGLAAGAAEQLLRAQAGCSWRGDEWTWSTTRGGNGMQSLFRCRCGCIYLLQVQQAQMPALTPSCLQNEATKQQEAERQRVSAQIEAERRATEVHKACPTSADVADQRNSRGRNRGRQTAPAGSAQCRLRHRRRLLLHVGGYCSNRVCVLN